MKQSLRSRTFSVLFSLLLFLGGLAALPAAAQCPIASSCTPGNPPAGNLIFGMGIFNVNVNNGAINNTTQGASQGYQDYSCTIGTTLTSTVSVPISIQTNNNANENVRVWIDYNNDGVFHATNELAFSSNNQKLHTGTITPPATATLGTPLRMRVSADNFSSPIPTPCSTPQYSQVEDYRVTFIASTVAPVAEFSANNTTTCTSSVCFTDLSQNGPTSWLWNFGDPASGAANTSTLQNPCHTFSAPGTYTVSLTATNANGSHTVTKTNYITYHNNVPVAATCTPNTAQYCCNYGITNVNFGNGLMTNSSANGVAGYQDFTCTKSVTVMAGNTYPIALTTGSNPHDTRIYIDLNNDGSFTGPNEMVLQRLNQTNPTGTISIPGTTFTNTPLRMRIISDEIGSSFNSCTGIQTGQAEDYTIIITPNTNPPVAQFTSNYATACDTIVQFTDQSTNAPTSWLWNFGDPASGAANTSTLPNPVHIYRNAGNYTVTLTATNTNGSSTETKTNYITVVKPCLIYCPSSGHNNTNLHISNVSLNNLNNASAQAPGGYSNFTSLTANVIQGNPATLNVSRGGGLLNSSVSAWIDFNRNGTFEATERVMAVNGSSGLATATFNVPATAPLGATRMRVMTTSIFTAQTNPCLMNMFNMEVEDYTISVQTNQQPPIVDFTVPNQITCNGIVQFSDNSVNSPTSWSWNFGDPASGAGNTSTLQNPIHTFSAPGLYTVSLTATNSFGSNTTTKTNFINYDPTNAFCTSVTMPHTGTGPTATLCSGSIYDPGGPTGLYGNNANSTVTIAPTGAATVTLTFSMINMESCCDFIRVYDGPNTSSPLLGTYTGFSVPSPASVTSTGSVMTIQFVSDGSVVGNGFAATWSCTQVTSPPVARIRADFSNICNGPVSFQDNSTNAPTSWLWNFGNPASGAANTSTLQNPTHTYPTGTAGSYTVTLTATNAFGSHTVTMPNFVNITVPCLTYCAATGNTSTNQWISNVNLGTINNTTFQEPNGYANYTYLSTNLTQGATSPLSVTVATPGGSPFAYVSAWIDFNKDGIFQPTERVFNNQATSTSFGPPFVATGNITVPNTALTGSTRMRVIMTTNSNQSTACFTNFFNTEVEDYTVNIQPNTSPPVAAFRANLNNICSGLVSFQDNSANTATSWLWNFGDPASGAANTSTLQNPTHTYPTGTAGSYTVTLTVTNAFGSHTVTMPNFVNITVPCLSYCASTGHLNSNQWISNVTMGTINNTTAQEPSGYGNYIYLNTDLVVGSTANPLSVTVGTPGSQPFGYVSAWIDFNRDGTFQPSERVFNVQVTSPTFGPPYQAIGNISVPNTALTGFTRMRVILTTNSSLTSACIMNFSNTEVEDYAINIQPNQLPPVAGFTANLNNICTGQVTFQNNSANAPTSWLWNFGDPASGAANTSTLPNPTHTYPTGTAGSYTVTLTVTNAFGSHTVTMPNFVNITVPCLTYCLANNNINTNQWISNVTMGTINNTTVQETNGYGNYTYLSTNRTQGTTGPLSVTVATPGGTPFAYVSAWIDFNKDGIFQTSERVFNVLANSTTFGPPYVATGNITIPHTALTGTTRMRVIMTSNSSLSTACITNSSNTEVEDYMINIQPNTLPPVAMFSVPNQITCNGIVQFTDTSANNPTTWLWNFGDPASGAANTSTLQNPIHTFSAPGMYTVTLTVTNSFGTNTVTKTNYITYSPTNAFCTSVTMPHSGTGPTATLCAGTIYDPGGPNGIYGNNANSTVTIAPTGASTVTLTFSMINMESCCDFVRIYDGPNTSSPLLGTYTGFSVPNPASVTTTGPVMTVQFFSDGSVVGNGFAATWNCTQVTTPPVAAIRADFTSICTGLVSFQDNSTNAPTSWLWNFGDPASGAANTSTLRNPTHNYPVGTAGSYTVTLTTCNSFGCNTVTMNNYVNITVPCLTYCVSNGHNNTNQWISNVTMGTINNTTVQEPNGYGNYTYLNTTLTQATTGNPFSATLGSQSSGPGFIAIWIDFNKDGVFQISERVFNGPTLRSSPTMPYVASGAFNVPATSQTGVTRMRVIMSGNSNLTTPCTSFMFNAEVEDYAITIQAPNTPPTALFTVNNQTTCNGNVQFTDQSANNPTSWLWNFGDGNTSTLQNPAHAYTTPGTYTVVLQACNAFGCQTYTRTNYITYNPNSPACLVLNMPVVGSVSSGSCAGTLYDNGGPGSDYVNNSSGIFTIAPANATFVNITFSSFDLENSSDVLTLYDGPTTASTVIGTYTGTTLPNNGQPISSTGGSLTVRFTSNNTVTRPGFAATWNCSNNLGLKPTLNATAFSVYPNPSTGFVNLKLEEQSRENYQLQVTNIVGEVIYRKDVSFADGKEQTIDLSKLAKGVYFVKIQNSKVSGIRKVVLH